jgi:major membrane immunogen (membrane-anchored lipoprotein)
MNRTILASLLAAALALPACSHSHHARVADVSNVVTDPSFEGTWRGTSRTAAVKHAGDGYSVTITDNSGSQTYDVNLLDINGKRFVEILVHDPKGSKEVPVYLYGRLDIKGDTATYRRLRNEWLEAAAKTMEGVTYKSTSDVQPGTGGVVVRDAAHMHELLSKAAQDPAAFGEPEVAHRIK